MIATCYARVSTDDQAKKEKSSLADQVQWAKDFARSRGWEWHPEYIEPGVTGDTELEEREALSQAVQDGIEGNYDILLVYHSSRLSREPDIGMRVIRKLGQHKTQTFLRNSPIEPVEREKYVWGENIGAQYMAAFSLIGDLQENVGRSERVRGGFNNLAIKGILRNAPYGYNKVREFKADSTGKIIYTWHFTINEEKAMIVRKIFENYDKSGGSIRSIMLSLNRDKIASPSGKISSEAWTTATIKNILINKTYIGMVHWGKKLGGKYKQGKSIKGKQKRVFSPPEKWIISSGTHPRIIEDKQFNRVQEKLKIRSVLKGRAVASCGLLTGIIKCGRCGRSAYYKTKPLRTNKNKRVGYYACSSYYRAKTCQCHLITSQKIHKIIFDDISKIINNPNYREIILKQEDRSREVKAKNELSSLNIALEKSEFIQKRTLTAYQTEVMDLEEYSKAKSDLDNNQMQILKRIKEIDQFLGNIKRKDLAKIRFQRLVSDFKNISEETPDKIKKEFLQSILESVIVKNQKVVINYRID